MYLKYLLAILLFCPGLLLAESEMSQDAIEDVLDVKVRFATHMGYIPSIIRAVEAQNKEALSLDQIKAYDESWKNADEDSKSLIRRITQNDVAKYFRRRVENNPAIDEVFLTDNQGANVAAYPPTSDYWQGDEEKWTESFRNGDGVIYIGPLEFDESTQKTQVQISAPVVSHNETIGVLVLGVSVDYINTKQ